MANLTSDRSLGETKARKGYRPEERAFLPAALEILETPPSPTGRALAVTICAFVCIAVLWSLVGRVDIIATAPGRVLPVGRTKVVQPLEPGTVSSIAVEEGDHVRLGQLLIALDPTDPNADVVRLSHDLEIARLDVARLTALKSSAETGGPPSSLVFPVDATADQDDQLRAALRAAVDGQVAKVASLTQQIDEKQAEEREAEATIAKLQQSIPLLAQKEGLHKDLFDQGYGTSFAYLDAQQALSEAKGDLLVQAARADQARAAAADFASQRAQAVADYQTKILADLAQAETRANGLAQDLVKARSQSAATRLTAPVDGVVEQLSIHTVGGVVTPAQRLLVVVPDHAALTVEAQLANRDVGFVHSGQAVAVKVEAFNFTRYGLVRGRVISVSRDSLTAQPQLADAEGQAAQPTAEVPPPASANYVARIELERDSMMIDGKPQPLIPGMTVSAEIKTGSRTIIDYLLSPLARRGSEALRER